MRYLVPAFWLVAVCNPATAQTPVDGIRHLLVGLEHAEKASGEKDSLEGCLVALASLGSDLDTFELRYGVQPGAAPGWGEVKLRAAALLSALEAQPKDDVYFNRDSADTGICVLLELSGREQEALSRLDLIEPGGGCGNWMATVMQAVERRKAGIYQRKHDYKTALVHEEAARAQEGLSLYRPAPDLDGVRYGFLLEKTKRGRAAIPVYQRVVDLCPKSKGAELATKRLEALRAFITPTARRIVKLYIESKESRDYDSAIYALAGHNFPESFDILVAQLQIAKNWERNRVIPALGELGDRRAIPLLLKFCSPDADHANRLHAVAALHSLGNDSEIEPLLDLAARSDDRLDQDFTDRILRQLYGDGPVIENTWEIEPREFSRRWTEWIRDRRVASQGV